MKYLNKPVAYLQDSDLDSQGNIANSKIPNNIPIVCMAQANFCGYCTQAKPDFQQFANHYQGKVFCCTIQADGDVKGEKELGKRLGSILPSFKGFPHYVLYKGGKMVNKQISGRTVQDLVEFVN